MKTEKVIGIDPGTNVTGFGIIESCSRKHRLLEYGCIRPPRGMKLSERYHIIFESLEEILLRYHPEVLVVETQFVNKNVQSALKLGMARGVVILAATRRGIPIFEYSPTRAKKAVVGNGRASKEQVQAMVKLLLNMPHIPQPNDAADALALALCHLQSTAYKKCLGAEI